MILVDTSVWIEHLRRGEPRLKELLNEAFVLIHPFVLGELACGTMKNRATILGYIQALPRAANATHEETLSLMERRRLWGRGIGWMDAHLMASALLTNCQFWTLDGRLREACADSGLPIYAA